MTTSPTPDSTDAAAALDRFAAGAPHEPWCSAVSISDDDDASWLTYRDGSRLQVPTDGPAVVHPPLPAAAR